MHLQPYYDFDGRCDQAIEFYTQAIGAKLKSALRFKDSPERPKEGFPPEILSKVMHAELHVGDSTLLMSDGHCKNKTAFAGTMLTLGVASEAEADRCFAALAQGGQITMPLAKTFFASRFGMLKDRFGVSWIVIVRE